MRLAREEKKGRFIAMITIFVCLTAVFIFTLAKSQIIDGKKDTASNTASTTSRNRACPKPRWTSGWPLRAGRP